MVSVCLAAVLPANYKQGFFLLINPDFNMHVYMCIYVCACVW